VRLDHVLPWRALIFHSRVRGRHRGLPVAIDRAVMLPNELVTNRGDPQILSGGITDVTGVRTPHVQSPLAYES